MNPTLGPMEDQERSDEPEIPREVYREAARSGTLAGSPSWSSDPAALERLLDLWQADPWLRGVVESAYRAGRKDAAEERCSNCEHETRMHGDDGCWFCLDVGVVGESLVCKCPAMREGLA